MSCCQIFTQSPYTLNSVDWQACWFLYFSFVEEYDPTIGKYMYSYPGILYHHEHTMVQWHFKRTVCTVHTGWIVQNLRHNWQLGNLNRSKPLITGIMTPTIPLTAVGLSLLLSLSPSVCLVEYRRQFWSDLDHVDDVCYITYQFIYTSCRKQNFKIWITNFDKFGDFFF